jgi:hypothetical protein
MSSIADLVNEEVQQEEVTPVSYDEYIKMVEQQDPIQAMLMQQVLNMSEAIAQLNARIQTLEQYTLYLVKKVDGEEVVKETVEG